MDDRWKKSGPLFEEFVEILIQCQDIKFELERVDYKEKIQNEAKLSLLLIEGKSIL